MALEDLVLDTLDLLYGQDQFRRPSRDTLYAAVGSAAATTFHFDHPDMWQKDDYAEYWPGDGTSAEVVLFNEDHPPEGTGDVTRGELRTTAAASYAAGDVFLRNPRFPVVKVERAINETIDNDLYPEIYYRSARTLTLQSGRKRYPLNANDFMVEHMYQLDLNKTTLGAATFDVTGGALEDLWTLASHGLSVGDAVRFTAVGTGAEPYAVDTVYWVASVPDGDTFQLSATESTTVLEGTGTDSSPTWTLEKIGIFTYDPLPNGVWEHEFDLDTSRGSSTGNAILISTYWHKDHTIYYVARTAPTSSTISSLPQGILDMIPWGAAARLMAATGPPARLEPRRDSSQRRRSDDQPYRDASFMRVEFDRMKQQYIRGLKRKRQPAPRYKRRSSLVRRW